MMWLQIKQQAELYRRDTVVYPRRWFNEGKSLLATMFPTACNAKTEIVEVTDTRTPVVFPADCRYIKKIHPIEDASIEYTAFDADAALRQIFFRTTGTFVLTYLAETTDVVGADGETPEINPAYHYPLAKYIAARELEYVRPDWYQTLLDQFLQDAALANKSLKRAVVGPIRLPRRRFR